MHPTATKAWLFDFMVSEKPLPTYYRISVIYPNLDHEEGAVMFAVLFLSSLFPALLFIVRDLIFSFVVSF
jgi:hypothetical protein